MEITRLPLKHSWRLGTPQEVGAGEGFLSSRL